MRYRTLAVPAALLLATALAGCGGSGAAPGAASASPRTGGSYQDANALLEALSAAGVPCTSPSPVADPTGQGTLSLADCNGSGADSASVAVFDTHQDALASVGTLTAFGASFYDVVGVNWVVNTDTSYGKRVLAALGGTGVPVSASVPTTASSLAQPGGLDAPTCSALATAWSTFQTASAGADTMTQEEPAAAALGETVNAYGNAPVIRRYAADVTALTGAIIAEESADSGLGTGSVSSAEATVSADAAAVATDHQAVVSACG
jgi:hypothetical protein